MKIPLEWLKEYIKTDKSAQELAASFTALGLMLDKPVFKYENGDYSTEVLDLEHRMDRADWLSILGCACDLAAFEGLDLIMPKMHEEKPKTISEAEKIKIEVKCPEFVNRFNTRLFKNIKVGPSPLWLKNRLESYGIPSINNIVDITNYVMVEMGQPMHAQDLKKLEAPEIVIRRAKKDETMKTLLGETIVLDEDAFVLTQNDHPTVLGGIVGSAITGVDDTTTDIILDAGNYNQTNIRKTSRKVKIQNETVSRSDKFLHPYLTEVAIQRATQLILEIAGGEYYENVDWYPQVHPTKKLILTYARVKKLSGLDIPVERVKEILTKIEYRILSEKLESLTLEVPFFRTDVEVEDDIVSDVLRINDYANIPLTQVNAAPPIDITPKIYLFEDRLRDICVNLGLHEHITDPLVPADEHQQNQVKLENSQSQLKNAMRTNIHDGLKAVAQVYAKHQIETAELFEIGKVYWRQNMSTELKDFTEPRITQIYIKKAGSNHIENSTETRSILGGILSALGIKDYKLTKADYGKVAITTDGKNIGYMAWDQITLLNESLMPLAKTGARVVTEYTVVKSDDISILVPLEKNLGDVVEAIKTIDAKITDVEIIPQNYSGGDMKFKIVLARISHDIADFAPTREKILTALKEKLSVTTK